LQRFKHFIGNQKLLSVINNVPIKKANGNTTPLSLVYAITGSNDGSPSNGANLNEAENEGQSKSIYTRKHQRKYA
jgi:hypothetical protein